MANGMKRGLLVLTALIGLASPASVFSPPKQEIKEIPKPVLEESVKDGNVKGFRLNEWHARSSKKTKEMLDYFSVSDLNTVVLDVSDEYGKFAVPVKNKFAAKFNLYDSSMNNFSRSIRTYAKNGCRLGVRFVVAKDELLSRVENGKYAVKHGNGNDSVFVDLNSEFVREYKVTNYAEAISLIVNEIEGAGRKPLEINPLLVFLDYLRNPDSRDVKKPFFPFLKEQSNDAAVISLLKELNAALPEKLKKKVKIISCVYGDNLNPRFRRKNSLGQNLNEMKKHSTIAGMIYPYCYNDCFEVWRDIYGHTHKEISKLLEVSNDAMVWIQGDMGGIKNRLKERGISHVKLIEEQMRACDDAGIGYVVWSHSGNIEPAACAALSIPKDFENRINMQEKGLARK
ncbi:hypothetical protein JXB27_04020 [Candidatus Woesearchaeota archaeon]|nr:hypothetical protein [Candidatus Woesearchaeota archaeon]